ncbi:MAG: M13 family metallopeptidase [Novosphingobium sp.]|nr:M13 family metallopeptidase [Novosphingobium sp.]MBO9602923.1 M13 family metallopeptidase [Novosphingobium sp.]
MSKSIFAALLLGTATVIAGPIGCTQKGTEVAATPGTGLGIEKGWMDSSVKPGDDFYAYADGAWMRNTPIPADRSSVGGFVIASNQTEQQLGSLLADISKSDAADNTPQGRIRNLYNAYLDTAAIEQAGLSPIKPDLDRFAAIKDKKELSAVLGSQIRADVDPLNATNFFTENLFGIFVTQALAGKDVVPYILQGGLGMPEREYYLSSDPEMVKIRTAYKKYIADMLTAAGDPDAQAKAQAIFDLETKIAKAHATRAESEDFTKSAVLWSRADLEKKAPGIDWGALLDAAQLGKQGQFAAYHASAIPRLAALVQSEPLDAWKAWLEFHQINKNAEVLPKTFDQLSFAFNETVINGTPEPRSRDKRALAAVNRLLGDDLGKLYVDKYFPASAKAEIEGIVGNIKTAFGTRVKAIDWLAPATKEEALKKVETIQVGVGYPETWRDFSSVNIPKGNPYLAFQDAEKAEYAHQLAKIGKPLDKGEWWMTPQTINAVNLPVQNALNFPAAILQPPFFDPKADAAFNYGAIGAVIGHEISHSFDNNGAMFDSTGALHNWWTPEDLRKFEVSGKALADQFDTYEPFPGLHVNGELTLGENIADVAGLAAAYDAYHASLGGKEAPVIDGFTGDQRFFIAYAQAWATKMRDAALRKRIATDGHAPGQYRALTVRNLDAWYKAFDVKPGDKLYLPPEKRVRVW